MNGQSQLGYRRTNRKEVLEFRSNNDLHRPVIEALELLRKYASSKARYYDSSEEITIDGVLKSNAKDGKVMICIT